jgi:hypothetical protein
VAVAAAACHRAGASTHHGGITVACVWRHAWPHVHSNVSPTASPRLPFPVLMCLHTSFDGGCVFVSSFFLLLSIVPVLTLPRPLSTALRGVLHGEQPARCETHVRVCICMCVCVCVPPATALTGLTAPHPPLLFLSLRSHTVRPVPACDVPGVPPPPLLSSILLSSPPPPPTRSKIAHSYAASCLYTTPQTFPQPPTYIHIYIPQSLSLTHSLTHTHTLVA